MRITLDTNVLVGAHEGASGQSRQILALLLRIRSLYGLTDLQIRQFIDSLAATAELVDIGPNVQLPLTDRDDWAVLRTAIEGNADVICTSDAGFHVDAVLAFCERYDLKVVKPSELLRQLSRT